MRGLTEIFRGVIEGCILEIIDREDDTYAYGITKRLNKLGFTDVSEGIVYTILMRFDKSGFIDLEKGQTNIGPPRKLYSLTDLGHKELKNFWEKWELVLSKTNELKNAKPN